MNVSLTTDYQGDTGRPEAALRAIAEAGFTHVHWCHHWNTDFLYGSAEIAQIQKWLREFGLKLLDLHGSAGKEKCWHSAHEYERLAGVELVANRLQMTSDLGGSAVVMHLPTLPPGSESTSQSDAVRKSIEELSPVILRTNVRLALENMANDDFKLIGQLLEEFGSDLVGICYDCGHGNIRKGEGLDHLERFKDRLIAVHIHDNDGTADHHWVPFTGTVDFPRLARIIAASSYTGCISLESNINSLPEVKKATFVKDAFEAATRLAQMVEDEKESLSKQEA